MEVGDIGQDDALGGSRRQRHLGDCILQEGNPRQSTRPPYNAWRQDVPKAWIKLRAPLGGRPEQFP